MTRGDAVLLTGATGYVGGRLLPLLENTGRRLVCLARQPEHLRGQVAPGTAVARGDVLDPASMTAAMAGAGTAYYLVHSMGAGHEFRERDRRAARSFGESARASGVRRIIYLGGLGEGRLSPHLASRQEVGDILRASGLQVIELRAGIIIGSGSASFEMIRALVERLPVMITPRWVGTKTQPIAIEDVLDYLLAALETGAEGSVVYEIGGADQASYRELMAEYGRQRGLRRLMVPVPLLTPHLSSLWLGLVTPVYARIGRQLIDGLRNETVVRDRRALRDFDLRPRGYKEAIARALHFEDREFAQTRWSDALSSADRRAGYGGFPVGSRLVDARAARVPVTAEAAFAPIARIGGGTGWYYGDWLWTLRGFLDLLVGGAGGRRGRRHPTELRAGDTLDFWRVEEIDPGRLLRLVAEMRLPGRAWLQFEVRPDGDGAVIQQTALFHPRGVAGLIYWYASYPVHALVFSGMLRGIVRAAVHGAGRAGSRGGPPMDPPAS